MPNQPTNTNKQQAQAGQENRKSDGTIRRVAEALATYIEAENAKRGKGELNEQRKLRREGLGQFLSSLALVIALAGLGVSLVQARTAREALLQVQRAFVSLSTVSNLHIKHIINNVQSDGWEFTAKYENVGGTATRKLIGYSKMEIIEASKIPSIDFKFPDSLQYPPIGIGPHGTLESAPVFAPEQSVDGLGIPGNRDIVFWGTVYYQDVFGGKHLTEFCSDFNSAGRAASQTEPVLLRAQTCQVHNCTDEDCSVSDLKEQDRWSAQHFLSSNLSK